jgi:putative membrane-bound dehydrogenase-like protein
MVLGLVPLLGSPVRGPGQEPDFADRLPRIPPKSPEEAHATFSLRPGFELELVAAEPNVRSPVAIEFDERGRLWVAEYAEYNQYADPASKEIGAIRLLEDRDADGRYETATEFAERLPFPTALHPWRGGLFVGAAPDILYLKDTDGDGKADLRQVIFTGFGRDHAGEALINSFRLGLDARLHLSCSLAGGDVRRIAAGDGTGSNPAVDAKSSGVTRSVRGRRLVFDPRSDWWTTAAGGGQHGLTFDAFGNAFVCENSVPFLWIATETRYLDRAPFADAPAMTMPIAAQGKFTKLARLSADEPWRTLRTKLRSEGAVAGSDEGGRPSGFFTGATGVTVYDGDAWPAEYKGSLLVAEVSNNLIHRAKPLSPGWTASPAPKAVPAEQGREFLASSDNWFRPAQLAHGPDGCLFVVDMYREFVEAAVSVPPAILKHLDVRSGINRGRIWRIKPAGKSIRRGDPGLAGRGAADLVLALNHSNGWHRETAARLLLERGPSDEIRQALRTTAHSPTALGPGRLRAAGLLFEFGALDDDTTVTLLNDADPEVRRAALVLAEERGTSPPVIAALKDRLLDPDPAVRRQACRSLTFLPLEDRLDALARRTGTASDLADSAAALALGDRLAEAIEGVSAGPLRARQRLTQLLLVQASRANDPAALRAAVRSIENAPERALNRALDALLSHAPSQLPNVIRERNATGVEAALAKRLTSVEQRALDRKRSTRLGTDELALLTMLPLERRVKSIVSLIREEGDEMPAVAIRLARGLTDERIGAALLERWNGLSTPLRASALEALLATAAARKTLAAALESGKLDPGGIDAERLEPLRAIDPNTVGRMLARVPPPSRLVLEDFRPVVSGIGAAANGRSVFEKHCAACHRLAGIGAAIGPELLGMRDRGREATLLNIIDPSRDLKPQYRGWLIVLTSGESVSGMIASETRTTLTLRLADGTARSIPISEIESRRESTKSFMPEGFGRKLSRVELTDLLAFLMNPK